LAILLQQRIVSTTLLLGIILNNYNSRMVKDSRKVSSTTLSTMTETHNATLGISLKMLFLSYLT